MATWEAIVGSTTYNLSDANPFKLISVTGVGNAPVRRLEERGPFQDGVTDVGYRFDPRIINMVIGVHGTSLSTADTNRDTLSAIFNPTGNAVIQLRCTRDDSSVRQIDCHAVNMVDMPAQFPERVLTYQRVGVQLKAPNPFWYDPTQQVATFGSTVDWHTGGGMIGTASIMGTAIAPAVADAMLSGTISSGSPFTVFARTSADTDADVESFLWAGGFSSFSRLSSSGNETYKQSSVTIASTAFMTSGTHCYFFVSDGAILDIYEGTVQTGHLVLGTVTGLYAPGRWRGFTAGNDWNTDVTHAAVYSVALTDAQRNGIISALEGSVIFAANITAGGNVNESPIIVLAGPMNDPLIRNHTTGETLDFTGGTIAGSALYTIDTRYGYKTVSDSGNTNLISQLNDDSDLATFHLDPGTNNLTLSTSGTSATSAAVVYYYNRYLGL